MSLCLSLRGVHHQDGGVRLMDTLKKVSAPQVGVCYFETDTWNHLNFHTSFNWPYWKADIGQLGFPYSSHTTPTLHFLYKHLHFTILKHTENLQNLRQNYRQIVWDIVIKEAFWGLGYFLRFSNQENESLSQGANKHHSFVFKLSSSHHNQSCYRQ